MFDIRRLPIGKQPDQAYDTAFFDTIEEVSLRAARILLPHVLNYVPAQSVVDVGCGRGTWLSVARELGVDEVFGLDGEYVQPETLLIPRDRFSSVDLEKPLALQESFDLALSLEVAEHLSPQRADSFVSDLCRLSPAVLFSAAIPRQGGTHHINEQWQSYWREKFQSQGFVPVDILRAKFWDDYAAGVVYVQNAFLYCRKDLLDRNASLLSLSQLTAQLPVDVVHPVTFLRKNSLTIPEEIALGPVLRSIPFAARRSLARWYYKKFKGQ